MFTSGEIQFYSPVNPYLLSSMQLGNNADSSTALAREPNTNDRSSYSQAFNEFVSSTIYDYLQIHRRVAARGVSGVSHNGAIRTDEIYSNYTWYSFFEGKDVAMMRENPYLSFQETGRSEGKILGVLHYADPRSLGEEAMRRLTQFDPSLAQEVRDLQQEYQRSSVWQRAPNNLVQRALYALVQERIEWFKTERSQLGDKISENNLSEFIRIASVFYRDLISIHPFEDCNGRATRLFALYGIFIREGLAPPRFRDIDEDFTLSNRELEHEIQEGLNRSNRLYAELAENIRQGRPLEDTVRIAIPDLPDFLEPSNLLMFLRRISFNTNFDPNVLIRAYNNHALEMSFSPDHLFD